MAGIKILDVLFYGIIAVFLVIIAPGLITFRLDSYGASVYYLGSIPIAIGGFYFFTFISILLSLAIAIHKNISIPGAILLSASGLSLFESLLAFSYALYAENLGLLIPVLSFPASGWEGYGTWFVIEILVALISKPYWKTLRINVQDVNGLE